MKKIFLSLLISISFATSACAGHNIYETLKNDSQFSTLVTAIESADLISELEHNDDITLFAPTNHAFESLGDDQVERLLSSPQLLKNILLFHIADERLTKRKLSKRVGLNTLSQEFLKTENIDIKKANIKTSNGIIHSIANVLTPSGIAANPATSEVIDIEKYMGLWYEIGRYSNSFQEDCGQTTAFYSLREDGKVDVRNTCKLFKKGNKIKVAKAIASVKNKQTNSELAVSFVPFFNRFGLFAGDYRILDIGADYEWVIVGDIKREYFWVLSRTPVMDETLYSDLLVKAKQLGFDPAKVIKSPTWIDID